MSELFHASVALSPLSAGHRAIWDVGQTWTKRKTFRGTGNRARPLSSRLAIVVCPHRSWPPVLLCNDAVPTCEAVESVTSEFLGAASVSVCWVASICRQTPVFRRNTPAHTASQPPTALPCGNVPRCKRISSSTHTHTHTHTHTLHVYTIHGPFKTFAVVSVYLQQTQQKLGA
jgi:hypothetical protein